MQNIKFSFIVPHFNLESRYLRRLLDSIPHREDIQIIVVDDHSPYLYDANDNLIEENKRAFPGYGETCTDIIFLPKNGGPGKARNEALKVAKGEWILFADADDRFDTTLLDRLLHLVENSSYDVIYYEMGVFEIDSPFYVDGYDQYELAEQDVNGFCKVTNRNQFFSNGHQSCKKISKHSLFIDNNIRFEEITYCEDQRVSVDLIKYSKSIAVWPYPVYQYYRRSDSTTKTLPYQYLREAMYSTMRINRELSEIANDNLLIVSSYILAKIRGYSYSSFLFYSFLNWHFVGWKVAKKDYVAACRQCFVNPNPLIDFVDRIRVKLGEFRKK